MSDPFTRIADGTASDIDRAAAAAFDRFWKLVEEGMPPRAAIETVQAEFAADVREQLQTAFSELLVATLGTTDTAALPTTPLILSSLLYRQTAEVANRVAALVQQHANGVHQARELALQVYDGYVKPEPDVRPLEGRAMGQLPQDLRALLRADPSAKRELTRLLERARAQTARLRTAPLRAAYSEALDKWEAGAKNGLRRELKVAFAEKNRYFANRIAQTELARAYQKGRASEYMADDAITVLQVRISPGHPRLDICDLHARADLFGLGQGCYPKALAPLPPYHPFCRCRLRDRPDLSVSKANPASVAKYLESLPAGEAAKVMGSRDRLHRVLTGEPYQDVINSSKDPNYWLQTAGDVPPSPPLAP